MRLIPIASRLRLRALSNLVRDDAGATAIEWTLLLAAIALPAYAILRLALGVLVAHYQMMTLLNSLPFP